MATRRKREPKSTEVKFVDEIPPKGAAGIWVERLNPLILAPGRPAQVFEAESDEQANNAVDNLKRRRVTIPHPDHHWEFFGRSNLVFAIYKGPGARRRKRASVR